MADIADRAQGSESLFLLEAQSRHEVRRQGSSGLEFAAVCAECGEMIPERRRAAIPGCVLCVECQSEKDNENGRIP